MTSLPQLIKMLDSDQPDVRYDACQQLTTLPVLNREAIKALGKATQDLDSKIAREAQIALDLHKSDLSLDYSAHQNLSNSATKKKNDFYNRGSIEKLALFLKLKPEVGQHFCRAGMLIAFLGTFFLSLFVGLVLFVLTMIGCHVPVVFPLFAGMTIAIQTTNMGKHLGHCRNWWLAISIPILGSLVAWTTEHYAGALFFTTDLPSELTIPFTVINFGGLILADSITISGLWVSVYWVIELAVFVGSSIGFSGKYPSEPYCEKCRTWRKSKTPLAGVNALLDQAQPAIHTSNTAELIEAIECNKGENNITRLEVEFYPECFDSTGAKLITSFETGQDERAEILVWEGILKPQCIRELVEHASE